MSLCMKMRCVLYCYQMINLFKGLYGHACLMINQKKCTDWGFWWRNSSTVRRELCNICWEVGSTGAHPCAITQTCSTISRGGIVSYFISRILIYLCIFLVSFFNASIKTSYIHPMQIARPWGKVSPDCLQMARFANRISAWNVICFKCWNIFNRERNPCKKYCIHMAKY